MSNYNSLNIAMHVVASCSHMSEYYIQCILYFNFHGVSSGQPHAIVHDINIVAITVFKTTYTNIIDVLVAHFLLTQWHTMHCASACYFLPFYNDVHVQVNYYNISRCSSHVHAHEGASGTAHRIILYSFELASSIHILSLTSLYN